MARFSEMDAVEDRIGKSVVDMTADELVNYIKTYMKALHRIDLAVDPIKERSILTAFKKMYRDDAGPIVKWVMSEHKGKNSKGKLVTPTEFQKSNKWWTDEMHLEMQLHRQRSDVEASLPKLLPFSTLK